MNGCGVILGAIGFAGTLALQAAAPGQLLTVRSGSGQFVVIGPARTMPGAAAIAVDTNGPPLLELEPNTLVVTCERVRQAVLWELSAADRWTGRIYLSINPALTNDQSVLIAAAPFRDGWQYRVEVPQRIQPVRLVRGLVQVLLLEVANRTAGWRSAELPLWLSEGMTQHLLRTRLVHLTVAPPRQTFNRVAVGAFAREVVRPDPLAEARERLQSHAAMSLSRMGEWTPDRQAGESWKTFQASTQLLVSQLLCLPGSPGGRSAVTGFLMQLPHCLNWQTAFLSSFQPWFRRSIDAEKWWSVVLAYFTGLDSLNAWTPEIAHQKLEAALHPPVLVTRDPKDLPYREKVALQRLIRDWTYLQHRLLLHSVVSQLATLRSRLSPELVPLADRYQAILEDYTARRDRAGINPPVSAQPRLNLDRVVRETLEALDTVDAERERLRSRVSAASAPSAPSFSRAR